MMRMLLLPSDSLLFGSEHLRGAVRRRGGCVRGEWWNFHLYLRSWLSLSRVERVSERAGVVAGRADGQRRAHLDQHRQGGGHRQRPTLQGTLAHSQPPFCCLLSCEQPSSVPWHEVHSRSSTLNAQFTARNPHGCFPDAGSHTLLTRGMRNRLCCRAQARLWRGPRRWCGSSSPLRPPPASISLLPPPRRHEVVVREWVEVEEEVCAGVQGKCKKSAQYRSARERERGS